MSLVYTFWYMNNTIFSACNYYVTPLVMSFINKYGYTVGLTVYNVAKADILFPITLYKLLK